MDDSRGDVGDVFRAAVLRFEDIGPRVVLDPAALAARIWDALRDNGYGEFDGIIGVLAPTLGEEGLQALKDLTDAYSKMSAKESPDDHEALRFLRDLRSDGGNYASDQKDRFIKMCLQEIAEAQGDTAVYIAQYSAHDLARPDIAAEVAHLLLAQGKAEDAVATLTSADLTGRAFGQKEWDAAYIDCLIALDRIDEALRPIAGNASARRSPLSFCGTISRSCQTSMILRRRTGRKPRHWNLRTCTWH